MDIKIECPHCGYSKAVAKEKIPEKARWAICPRCRQRFQLFQDVEFQYAGPETFGKTGERSGSADHERASKRPAPWEMRDSLGLWSALFQTVKEVLLSPEKLFKEMQLGQGQREPLAFGVLTGSVGSMFSFFWQILMVGLGIMSVTPPIFGHFGMGVIFLIMFLCLPLMMLIGLYIMSGVTHVLLIIVGAAKNGFEATFRVVCYSHAAQLIGLVPIVGGWVAGIWQIIIQIIGLKEIHETSYLRVIMAFLIPLFVFVLILVAILIPIILHILKNPHIGLGLWS